MRYTHAWLAAVLMAAGIAGGAGAWGQQAGATEPGVPALLQQSRALGDAGRHAEAYALLAAQEDAHIGEVEFDYAFGRAALAAGLPAQATLAFTRVLALQPGHAGAAIDTGRAYLALGNRTQARASFEALLALDPPPAIREQLSALIAQSVASEPRLILRGHLAATLGHDSNVNAGTALARVFVPLFGSEVQLADANLRRADRYTALSGALDATLPIDAHLALVGGVEFLQRRNAHESAFDLGGASARLGVAATRAGWIGRAQLLQARAYLDGRATRNTGAALFELTQASATAPWSVFAQAGRHRYPDAGLRVFDADFVSAGLGRSWPIGQRTHAYAGYSAGQDADRGGYAGGDRRQNGPRLALEHRLQPRLALIVSAAWQETRYERTDPTFRTVRRDRRGDLEIALQLQLDDFWQVRAGLLESTQRSSLPIHAFTRQDWGISLRRNFR